VLVLNGVPARQDLLPGNYFTCPENAAGKFIFGQTRIPAEVFNPGAFAFHGNFDMCKIGQKLILTVQNHAKKAILFRAGIFGTTVD
jgi:hypothetical protein